MKGCFDAVFDLVSTTLDRKIASEQPFNMKVTVAVICLLGKKNVSRPGVLVVSVSSSLPGGYEFETWLRRHFFPAYFRLSPLLKHVRKVVYGFEKKLVLVTGVRKPGNTGATPTAMICP